MDKRKINFSAKRILVKADPEKIAEIHGIIEACDYLAVVRTLDPDISVVELITTHDTFEDTLKVARVMEKLLGVEVIHPTD